MSLEEAKTIVVPDQRTVFSDFPLESKASSNRSEGSELRSGSSRSNRCEELKKKQFDDWRILESQRLWAAIAVGSLAFVDERDYGRGNDHQPV